MEESVWFKKDGVCSKDRDIAQVLWLLFLEDFHPYMVDRIPADFYS